MTRHVLVLGDSLTFHGPDRVEAPATPGLWPNICRRQLSDELGEDVEIDLVARLGYTARDGWWALTKDPVVWGTYLPRARGVVLAQGQFDQLPAAIPTWARESIKYVSPGRVRRAVRRGYRAAAPTLMRLTDGRMTQLSNTASNHYLTRITDGIRYMRPDLPIVRLLAAPYDSTLYPSVRPHAGAVTAGRAWCAAHDVTGVDLDDVIVLAENNPDGLHWGWTTHQRVGRVAAEALLVAGMAAHRAPMPLSAERTSRGVRT